jgi:hypothetical protein
MPEPLIEVVLLRDMRLIQINKSFECMDSGNLVMPNGRLDELAKQTGGQLCEVIRYAMGESALVPKTIAQEWVASGKAAKPCIKPEVENAAFQPEKRRRGRPRKAIDID